MIRRAVLPAVACAAAAVTLAACGGASHDGRAGTATHAGGGASGTAVTQATVQAADCNLWTVLDHSQRVTLLQGFRVFFGARIDQPEGRGPTLTDEQAEALLQRFCSPSYAGAFKLYKIYGRAAAFGG